MFVNIFKHLWNHWADWSQISCGTSLGRGERKFIQRSRSYDQDGRNAIYGKNLKKIFSSKTNRPMILKLGMQHWVLEYYQFCSNEVSGLTLTYFTAKSKLVPYAFVWEKGKTMDFSENIVVYDFKLATDDKSDKKFLLTSKLCSLGSGGCMPPAPGLYACTCIKLWKKSIKSDFKEISLKHATNG